MRLMNRRRRWHALLFTAAVPFLLTMCKQLTDATPPGQCQTRLDIDANGPINSSPTVGALTFHGNFYQNETLKLTYVDAGGQAHVVSGTPATDRTTFTLTGLPSGTRVYEISVSCDANGSHELGNTTLTVQ